MSPSPRKSSSKSPPKTSPTLESAGKNFLIVAVGASAGGMEAFAELLSALPADTGMAFVLVQHLDPKHHSMLTELLAKQTRMYIQEVKDGMRVEPNHVYVIPPNTSMSITDHLLKLGPRRESHAPYMAIDHFMRSLAVDQRNRAIGVLLSGSGSDGTLGLAEIQAQGGVTFAQEEVSAKYAAMPHSAIAAGYVDYVLPPKQIARELARIGQHPYVSRTQKVEQEYTLSDGAGLNAIFHILRRATSVDFVHYRRTTILRRIERRMVVHKIDNLADYVKYVQTHPAETQSLYQDILINVTSFFRNPEVFDELKARYFRRFFENLPADKPLRVWMPGCSSGEEAYSVAITVLEFLGERAWQTRIQLFGTDISEVSIARARNGVYPENIEADVSPERLRKFFTKAKGGYAIDKYIRELCIFAPHNVLSDAPFSRMHLVCCRNLLIYLEPILQSKVISLFHYALQPDGLLVLGTSEGIGGSGALFSTEDRLLKIFAKKENNARSLVTFSLANPVYDEGAPPRREARHVDSAWMHVEAQKEFDRLLLNQHSPPAVFVDSDLEIVHTRGDVSRYLKMAPGRATLGILKMAREGLLLPLRSAIAQAKREHAIVRRQRISFKMGKGADRKKRQPTLLVNLEVVPVALNSSKEDYFMVLFEEIASGNGRKGAPSGPAEDAAATKDVTRLEQELVATKEYLQSIIETHEATNEELQSANEEILSSNEELQSTNEELETAKEELQSTNEELSTVNDELLNRNSDITEINGDLTNLLSVLEMAIIIIGKDLTIRRFTPMAQQIFGLIATDLGRPLANINPSLDIPDFHAQVLKVVSDSHPIQREVTDKSGNRYTLKIVPYISASASEPDGALITVGALL